MGDRIRLGDTALLIDVERDATVLGDEVRFGGGKVIRDGMGHDVASISAGTQMRHRAVGGTFVLA